MDPYPPTPPPPQEDSGATASMVLGILGLMLCGLLAPIALFMGLSAKRRIRESGGHLGGDGQATAGVVMGAIGSAILALAFVVLVIALIALVVASPSGTG